MSKQISSISREAMDRLTSYAWPGNIRELANFIERAVIVTRGQELHVSLGAFDTAPTAIATVGS